MLIDKNHIKMRDMVSLNLVNLIHVKDNFLTPVTNTPVQTGLLVRIAATHSGIVNRNNMFYLPDRMREGAASFTAQFNKPILLNHDDHSDPIGRVIQSKYVDISNKFKDQYKGKTFKDAFSKKILPFEDGLLDSFCNGGMPYGAQVDFVRSYLSDSILDDPNYEGLGYVEIVANITDQEAIQKFLDGRYLTGSVGAATDKAVCSICKQDWAQEGRCDHDLGKVYDSHKAFLVAGKFAYEEFSVANKPADRHAKVIELNYNGLKDSYTIDDKDFSGRIYEVKVESWKENDMLVKDTEGTEIKTEVKPEVTEPVITDVKIEESVEDFVTRVLDSKTDIVDADEEKLYSLLVDEMKAAGLSEKEITDATLSTEKRKALAASTFCGPGRSFPVPDCAHVTAARRLVNRFKGDKTGILTCVDRKAKAMGCDKMMKDEVTTETVKDDNTHATVLQALLQVLQTNEYAGEPLDSKDLSALQSIITKLASMVTEDNMNQVLSEGLGKKLKVLQDKALLDEVVRLETELGNLNDKFTNTETLQKELETLKEEYKKTTQESELLQDEVVKTKSALRSIKIEQLGLFKSLKSGTVEGVVVDSEIADTTLDSELTVISKEVDIKKITDKLNDGTSRKPTGNLEDPNQSQDGKKLDVAEIKDRLKHIQENYVQLKFSKGTLVAEKWLDNQMATMRLEGLLPTDSK